MVEVAICLLESRQRHLRRRHLRTECLGASRGIGSSYVEHGLVVEGAHVFKTAGGGDGNGEREMGLMSRRGQRACRRRACGGGSMTRDLVIKPSLRTDLGIQGPSLSKDSSIIKRRVSQSIFRT